MMSPRLSAVQHRFAEARPSRAVCLAQRRACGRLYASGGASVIPRAAEPEDHTSSSIGQPIRACALLSDFSTGWFSGHSAAGRKSGRELVQRHGVCRIVDSSEGAGTCPFVTSSSRLARQPVWPHAATTSANKVWAAQPSAQVRQPSQAGRWRRAQPSALQPTSVTVSSTPANVTDPATIAALPAIRAGRAASLSSLPLQAPAQPRLTRLFALPAFVKGTADV